MLLDQARPHRGICSAALASCLAAVGCLTLPVPPVARALTVLVFCCWAPGVALFAGLRAWELVRSPAATIAASAALIILLSQALLALRLWSPGGSTVVLAALCAVVLAAVVLGSGRTGRTQ